MSKTLFVEFRGKGFWAFDVLASVFLKFLIAEATPRQVFPEHNWLVEAINAWRVNAILSDFGLHLNEHWSDEQVGTVIELCRAAIERIEVRGDIPASEVTSEPLLDDQYIFLRGIDPVPYRPVVRLGYAIICLLDGTLAEPPLGYAWMYELEPQVRTIAISRDSR